uniref:Uncharacterized protein n=1 Tax=Caenorhabditis japonica TaxID=281687 RepID=A0A8R1HZZ0_CAEJA
MVVPYAKILKSPAFLAQLLCQFVINSIVTLLQIYLPLYFKDVLHLSAIADTLAEWQTLFLCCAAANLICGTVFLVFGSGELQEWGLEDPSDEPRPLEMEKTPLQSIQNIPESEDGDVFQSALDMEIPEIQINEITLTTEERERFKRRIREDSMCL